MRIDVARFFDAYRKQFERVSVEQVGPLEFLVTSMSQDPAITDYRHAAYMLATVRGECGESFEPVEEGFYLEGLVKDLDAWRKRKLRYYPWHGRGFVQLTWERNYQFAAKELGLPLLATRPEIAMEPDVAYRIMSRGMMAGWFTGKSLPQYINGYKCDYANARRIINGTDRKKEFAAWARQFDEILSYAEVEA